MCVRSGSLASLFVLEQEDLGKNLAQLTSYQVYPLAWANVCRVEPQQSEQQQRQGDPATALLNPVARRASLAGPL